MKGLSLLIWVTQFGFSAIFPICAFLLIGTWLQNTYDLGSWVLALCGVLGTLTSVRTVLSCVDAMRREAGLKKKEQDPQVAYNDHE